MATCTPSETTSLMRDGDGVHDVGIDSDATASEYLAGELDHHPLVGGMRGRAADRDRDRQVTLVVRHAEPPSLVAVSCRTYPTPRPGGCAART